MLTQVISVVVLARLLTPTDYGLVAMVLSVIGIAELVRDFGLSPAAIRAETLSKALRNNLFWVNTGLGVVLALIVVAVSPLIARAFGRSELELIALALAPSFALSGISTQYRVDLARRFAFGRLAIVDLTCSVLPLMIGVVFALLGAGYWALVIQQLSSGVLAVVLLVVLCGWLPTRYDRTVSVAPMVRLGSSFVLGGLLGYVIRNADTVLVGRRFGADALGLYTRSVQLVRTPLNQLQAPFATVALPVFAASRDDDVRLMRATVRAQIAFAYPVMTGVAWVVAAAPDVVLIFLGDEWSGAAPVMTYAAIAGGVACLGYPTLWVFAARAVATRMNLFNLASAALTLVGIVVGSFFGVEGVAAGIAVATTVGWPLSLVVLSWGNYLPVSGMMWAGVRTASTTIFAAAAAHIVWVELPMGSATLRATIALAVVLFCMGIVALVPPVRRDYAEVRVMFALLRRRRSASSAAEPLAAAGADA